MMKLFVIRSYCTRSGSERVVQLMTWKFINIFVFTRGSAHRDWWSYLVAARRAILG